MINTFEHLYLELDNLGAFAFDTQKAVVLEG